MILNTQGLFEWLSGRSFLKKIVDIVVLLLLLFLGVLSYKYAETVFEGHDNDTYKTTINTSKLIRAQLAHIRYETKADAVIFFRYHNGTVGINGFSFIKSSATDIDLESEHIYDVSVAQNIPVTSDLHQVDAHLHNKCTFEVVTPTLQTYPLLVRNGIKSYATCPVYDYDNLLIGYVMIAYYTKINFDEVNLTKFMQHSAQKIGAI